MNMKKVAFEPEAFEQLGEWGKEDKKVFKKILELIKDIQADTRKLAIKESKNAKLGVRKPDESEYPLDLPFTLEQLLDEDFYGDML
ncbi:MAG: type II toxin-antitoxin system YoeB family toxin [Anabaena sp. 49628_E55]|jgi:mRNA-degrading endonuclease RelE of RelBE toxin-antitoxin system|nr:type II toxin-antitoxin system YoeB family toxin [Anabaena sp. 49628_E55]